MNYLITYLIIGFVISFLVDLLQDDLVRRGALPEDLRDHWGWFERFLCITIWPFAIYKFIEGWNKSNDDYEE